MTRPYWRSNAPSSMTIATRKPTTTWRSPTSRVATTRKQQRTSNCALRKTLCIVTPGTTCASCTPQTIIRSRKPTRTFISAPERYAIRPRSCWMLLKIAAKIKISTDRKTLRVIMSTCTGTGLMQSSKKAVRRLQLHNSRRQSQRLRTTLKTGLFGA